MEPLLVSLSLGVLMDELTRTLQRCLRQHLAVLSARDEIDMSASLVSLGLDSMSAISLMLDVEEAFSITFPRAMLDPKIFRTGDTLLAAVGQLVNSQPGASSTT